MITNEQKEYVKYDNNKLIAKSGYRINDWLPVLETSSMRSLEEIKDRMSVMNALINISFEAPVYIIKEWVEDQKLSRYLSEVEKGILEKENEQLNDAEMISLRWYLESLWALMWVTKAIEGLKAEEHVADYMASLLPNLEEGEGNEKLDKLREMRGEMEVYTMLDLYYRLHWYCVDERINGRIPKLDESLVYERRKALEWAFNRSADWDDVEMAT